MMEALRYNISTPTIHTFLNRFLQVSHADRTLSNLANYLAERSLQEYSTLKYSPSLIAAKSIHGARMSLRHYPWSPTLAHQTHYDEIDLLECGNEMREYLRNDTQETIVVRKYSEPRYDCVARMPINI